MGSRFGEFFGSLAQVVGIMLVAANFGFGLGVLTAAMGAVGASFPMLPATLVPVRIAVVAVLTGAGLLAGSEEHLRSAVFGSALLGIGSFLLFPRQREEWRFSRLETGPWRGLGAIMLFGSVLGGGYSVATDHIAFFLPAIAISVATSPRVVRNPKDP